MPVDVNDPGIFITLLTSTQKGRPSVGRPPEVQQPHVGVRVAQDWPSNAALVGRGGERGQFGGTVALSAVQASSSSSGQVLMIRSIGHAGGDRLVAAVRLPLELAGGVGVGVDREPAAVVDGQVEQLAAAGRAAPAGS